MAREDFIEAVEQLNQLGIVRVSQDFYMTPQRRGANYFVKSPNSNDKTWSLALYPANNRFCDFANGNRSGDIVGFLSYIRGINQWTALKELRSFYGLSGSREQDRETVRRKIQLQQEKERKRKKRQQEFETALFDEIEHLKRWLNIYTFATEKRLYEPYSELWTHCINECQLIEYKLDVLTAADVNRYGRMKKYSADLPSDRPQWILDCLSILSAAGRFQATEDEIREIRAQRNFELTRMGRQQRRGWIDW